MTASVCTRLYFSEITKLKKLKLRLTCHHSQPTLLIIKTMIILGYSSFNTHVHTHVDVNCNPMIKQGPLDHRKRCFLSVKLLLVMPADRPTVPLRLADVQPRTTPRYSSAGLCTQTMRLLRGTTCN